MSLLGHSLKSKGAVPTRPLCIDLCCGIGGWAAGFLAAGYRVVGFDIRTYPQGYPGELVLQDIRTVDGTRFRGARVIVASPPCIEFSRLGLPWHRNAPEPDLCVALFNECRRIIREAEVPGIIENVRMAQRWMGSAEAHFGSFYLWGDVPVLRPTMRFVKGAFSGRTVRMNAAGNYYRVKRSTQSGWHRVPHLRARVPLDLATWVAQHFLTVRL